MVFSFDVAPGGDEGRNSRKTAILILDFQNELAKPGGKLHSDGLVGVMEKTGMLQKVPHVIRAAR
jgi:nicotinamidase-related amidase